MSSQDPYSGRPNAAPQPQKSNKTAMVVILGLAAAFLAIPCFGILAAIAIPAFLRYIKKSKTAEADMVTSKMVTEAEIHYAKNCAFPPELQPHANIADCAAGEKCLPSEDLGYWSTVGELDQPTYFVYSALREGDAMVIRAEADFNPGEPYHTVQQTLTVVGECQLEAGPPVILNEFE